MAERVRSAGSPDVTADDECRPPPGTALWGRFADSVSDPVEFVQEVRRRDRP